VKPVSERLFAEVVLPSVLHQLTGELLLHPNGRSHPGLDAGADEEP